MGLEAYSKSMSNNLSGGEKRRLSISMVLSLNPKVLVLDEVTVGSDFLMKKVIWGQIKKVSRTKVIISHDMKEVKENSDGIFVLKRGVGKMLDTT